MISPCLFVCFRLQPRRFLQSAFMLLIVQRYHTTVQYNKYDRIRWLSELVESIAKSPCNGNLNFIKLYIGGSLINKIDSFPGPAVFVVRIPSIPSWFLHLIQKEKTHFSLNGINKAVEFPSSNSLSHSLGNSHSLTERKKAT